MSVPNLAAEAPTIETATETMWLPVWKDRDGNPIANAAKSLPIKPNYEPHSVYCYHMSFVRATYDGSKVRGLLDGVNNATWDGAWQPGEAWLSEIATKEIDVDGTTLRDITVTIRCLANRKWNTVVPEVGYFYLESSRYKPFVDSEGNRILGKLNSSGGKLSETSNLIFKEFDYKRSVNFSSITS